MSFSSIYLYVTRNKTRLLLIVLGLLVVFYVLSTFLCNITNRLTLKPVSNVSKRGLWLIFAAAFLIVFAVFIIAFSAAFPGSFENDSIAQMRQAVTGIYDDWHPIWHTLVYFTLPYRAFGTPSAVVVLQITYLSLAIAYMTLIILKHAGVTWSLISFTYLVFNPFTLFLVVAPLKDVGFATASLISMSIGVDIYFSGNSRKTPMIKCVILGFMLANAAIFRHNGILFSAFVLIALFFIREKRKWLVVVIAFAASMVIIQVSAYRLTDATHIDTAVIQVTGLPLSIIGNVAKDTPELLDEETKEFVYGIAPAEVWQERYSRGNFNLIKYGGIHDPDVIEEAGTLNIVKMALRSATASPQAALEAFFALTDFVYGFDVQDKADIDVICFSISDNDLGISYEGNERIAGLLNVYYRVLKLHGWNFIRKLGFTVFMPILVIAASCRLNSLKDWRRILWSFPLLAYDFGTMLLLSGHDARFFYVSFLIWPLTIIALLNKHNEGA